MTESEKAQRFDAIRERVYSMCQKAPQGDEDSMFVLRCVQLPATAEEAKAQRERIKEQARVEAERFGMINKYQYNVEGHVCPETKRLALTVRDVIELEKREGDRTSFVYDEEARGMGLDPWRMIDGIDPSFDGKTADLWWASGHSSIAVPLDKIIYVQQPRVKKAPPAPPFIVYEAERTCGNTKLGTEFLICRGKTPIGVVYDKAAAMQLSEILKATEGKP